MYSKTEAAYLILKEVKKPLHVREIIKIALSRNMIETKGETPWATLASELRAENKRKTKRGLGLRFVLLGKNTWELTELTYPHLKREETKK